MAVEINGTTGVKVPGGATGEAAPQAQETVMKVNGAARLPNWTTAGRPATPGIGDEGINTTLKCKEYFDGVEWVPDGWVYGTSVSLNGLSEYIWPNIPAYVNEICFQFWLVSTNSSINAGFTLGHAGGLVTTGYSGASVYLNMIGGSTGSGGTSPAGFFFVANSTNVGFFGLVTFKRYSGNIWQMSTTLNDQGNGAMVGSGSIDVGAPLTQFRLATGAVFDANCSAIISWRK